MAASPGLSSHVNPSDGHPPLEKWSAEHWLKHRIHELDDDDDDWCFTATFVHKVG